MPIRSRRKSALLALLLGPSAFGGVSLPPGFTDSKIAEGLNPTIMMFAPDGRLFVDEKAGKIRVIKNDVLLPAPFATVNADPFNERGLLGIEFDPDFAVNHYVYVFYTVKAVPAHNRVSRFTANGDVAAGPETVILDMTDLSSAGNHNGGTIQFGKDGKLYIAAGNNANNANSQSTANLLGKILRINADGSIPGDNPFAASATGKNRAIWALGFRNPFTFAIQPGTGRIFVNDVGEGSYEEVDELVAGANYGWPNVEGNSGTPPKGPGAYKGPVLTYTHDSGKNCAIAGSAFFNPARSTFPASYEGKYFFADYCGDWIKTVNPSDGNSVADFATGMVGPINIKAGPDGQLYYLSRGNNKGGAANNTASSNGEVHRIKGPVAVAVGPAGAGNPLPGMAAYVSGAMGLAWPETASQAEIFTASGRKVGILPRPGLGNSGVTSPALGEGIYRVRFLP